MSSEKCHFFATWLAAVGALLSGKIGISVGILGQKSVKKWQILDQEGQVRGTDFGAFSPSSVPKKGWLLVPRSRRDRKKSESADVKNMWPKRSQRKLWSPVARFVGGPTWRLFFPEKLWRFRSSKAWSFFVAAPRMRWDFSTRNWTGGCVCACCRTQKRGLLERTRGLKNDPGGEHFLPFLLLWVPTHS